MAKKTKTTKDEKRIIDDFLMAESLYETVLDQLNIPEDNMAYKLTMRGILERQSTDHMVLTVWKNLSDEQAQHLSDYLSQAFNLTPWLKTEDIILEFALMYPDLCEKIDKSMTGFFKHFIEKFNEISGFGVDKKSEN